MTDASHPAPFDVDEEAFLVGPDGRDADVDDVFAKPFERMHEEMVRFAPEDMLPEGPPRPSLVVDGVVLVDVPCGVLALDDEGTPIGGYLSCDLGVDEAWRDLGLGAELVIERCLADGANPVWHLDAAAYSEAGIATHRAAWRRARAERAETAARLERSRRGRNGARGE